MLVVKSDGNFKLGLFMAGLKNATENSQTIRVCQVLFFIISLRICMNSPTT